MHSYAENRQITRTTFTPNLNTHQTSKKFSPYSQALWITKICHEKEAFIKNCKTPTNTYQKRKYEKDFVEEYKKVFVEFHFEKVKNISRKELLTMKTKEPSKRIFRFQKSKSSLNGKNTPWNLQRL